MSRPAPFSGAANNGRVSAAAHADYADAGAVVVTEDGHTGSVYEFGGDQAFTMTEFAQALSEVSGRSVGYTDLSTDRYVKALQGFGSRRAGRGVRRRRPRCRSRRPDGRDG
ncbi:hypothetical protein [Rhodococcus opacus]|uniref:hypothetical protein n=1 Tax=Rhodococcus opacus TaxID=37919 RepID=UPI00155A8CE9|nr:hypothetical protein [Rhodococcus opacus]